jgi:tetratricopeptide (TPR) repeat protein
VRRQVSSLPDRLAERVARHLVMAGRLLEEDPDAAHQHARAARARAGRLAVVREACGETAYFAGRYSEALAELRAARRMNGSPAYLPMMADCERALGRPERAIALSRDPAADRLDDAGRAEMTIVVAGARRDRGETAAALTTLAAAPLHSPARAPWVARLRYAYADALLEARRVEDAVEWFHRTVAADVDAATDAAERLAALSDGEGSNPS